MEGVLTSTFLQNIVYHSGICLEGLTEDMKTSASVLVGTAMNSSLSGSTGFYISQFYRSGSHISLAMMLVLNLK